MVGRHGGRVGDAAGLPETGGLKGCFSISWHFKELSRFMHLILRLIRLKLISKYFEVARS